LILIKMMKMNLLKR